jgi:hypothetical protein
MRGDAELPVAGFCWGAVTTAGALPERVRAARASERIEITPRRHGAPRARTKRRAASVGWAARGAVA